MKKNWLLALVVLALALVGLYLLLSSVLQAIGVLLIALAVVGLVYVLLFAFNATGNNGPTIG